MSKVKVRNKKTGVVSELTQEQFDKTKTDTNWFNAFEVLKEPEAPKEVRELQQKQAEKTETKK